MSNPLDDPAYREELATLGNLCREFVAQEDAENGDGMLLVCGMMLAQLAAIYRLSPPAGLIDVPAMFQRDADL